MRHLFRSAVNSLTRFRVTLPLPKAARPPQWTKPILAALAVGLALSLTAGCGKIRSARHLRRADQYFAAGQYSKAEVEYLISLQQSPTNAHAISRLGLTYYTEGKPLRAFPFLQKGVALQPGNLELRLKLGMTCLAFRKLQEAREQALGVLAKDPGNEEALLLLADSVATAKEVPETLQLLERFRPQSKDIAGYHLARGTLYLRQSETNNVEAEFKQALALDPKSSAAHLAMGDLFLLRSDPKQAEPELRAAAQLAPWPSTARLHYADFRIRTGALAEAKKDVEEITRKAPDYVPAWNMLAQITAGQRQFDEAAALIRKVLALDPANYDALLLKGNVALAKGDGTNAIAQFTLITARYGRVPQVQLQLARAFLLSRDTTKAVSCLNQALATAPNFAEATLLLAEINVGKGDFAPAIAALTNLIQQRPDLAQAHFLLVSAYSGQRKLDEAVAACRRMMALFPKTPQVSYVLGTALIEQNKLTEARAAFEKSLELAPDYIPAIERLVDLDLLQKQYAQATERVKKEMAREPKAADPWLLLAKIHLAQHEPEQEETALLKAIELGPNLRGPYLLLAQLYVASNKQQQALDRLNGLLARHTNDVSALQLIGIIQDGLKNFNAARDAYERALAINPKFSPALNNLAYLDSEHLGQIDRACELARRARDLLPEDPSVADTLGWILYRKADYPHALTLLRESAAKLPKEREIQFHLGMAGYMTGDKESARLALQRALQDSKGLPDEAEGRRRLAILAINVQKADAATLAGLEKRMQDHPDDPVALGLLAAIYARDGATDKALAAYEKVVLQDPRNALARLNLAELYSARLNQPGKALEMAKEAHSLAPDDPRISHLLGRLAFAAGDHKWALSLLQESARTIPNDPAVLFDLGWACYSVGGVAEAETSMQAAAQAGAAFAKSDEARRFLTMVAASKNPAQAQAACAQAQQILTADANYVPALMVSAAAREQSANYAEAARFYDRVLARYPLFAPATRNLALLYADRLHDDQKAYELATQARTSFPDDPDLAKALGVLAYRRGDYSRSLQLLTESAAKRNTDADLLYYLGMCHYHLKGPAASRAALQRALDLNLETKLADNARKVLAQLK